MRAMAIIDAHLVICTSFAQTLPLQLSGCNDHGTQRFLRSFMSVNKNCATLLDALTADCALFRAAYEGMYAKATPEGTVLKLRPANKGMR